MNILTQKDLILKSNYQRKLKGKEVPTKEEREANNKYNRWYRKSNIERHKAVIEHSEDWKRENPERDRVTKKKWARNNKDKTRKAVNNWLKRNPDYHTVYYQKRKCEG